MSLLDKLHDKALTAKKKHIRYPALVLSGIADWIAGTYDEIKGHGETTQDTEDERDYKLYKEGVKGGMMGEVGAFTGAVYAANKPAALVIGADLLVRDVNALISGSKSLKQMREDPDSDGSLDIDMTGAIGTVRRVLYKLTAKYGRSGAAPEDDILEDDDMGEMPFSDPLPHPLKDDEMRIMDNIEPEEDLSKTEVEGPDYDILPFDPAPLPGPEPFDPEPVKLPGPDEGYDLPDILEPKDEPVAGYRSPDISDVELVADEPLEDAAETPSSKPVIDIGPLGSSYTPPEAEPEGETEAEPEDDDEDPLAFVDEEDTGNTLF